METIQNNKLFAEFLGLNLYRGYWYESTIATERKICKEQVLKFHSDWNWLMQIIEKIESLKTPYEGFSWGLEPFSVVINRNSVYIQVDAGKSEDIIFPDRHCKNKIEMVYNTCVEFIKWYNENKQD